MANKDFMKAKSDNLGVVHLQVSSLLADTYNVLPTTSGTLLVENSLPGLRFVGNTGMTGMTGLIGPTGSDGNEGLSPIGNPGSMGAIGSIGINTPEGVELLCSGTFNLQNSASIPFTGFPPYFVIVYTTWESDVPIDDAYNGMIRGKLSNNVTQDISPIYGSLYNYNYVITPYKGASSVTIEYLPLLKECYYKSNNLNSLFGTITIKVYGWEITL